MIVLSIDLSRLAQVFGHLLELVPMRHLSNAMCCVEFNSDTCPKTCASLGGAMHNTIVRIHDLGKTKTIAGLLKCMCISLALALLIPHTTTNHEGLGPQRFDPKWWKYEYKKKQRVMGGKQQHSGMEDFFPVQRTHPRNKVSFSLICSIPSEILQQIVTLLHC